ncbi:MAG TPA: hypothetical protein VF383_11050, partial [Candidatus Dormibacteraeota bacterium]
KAAGEIFRPYRSIAALYCWRVVDTVLPVKPKSAPLASNARKTKRGSARLAPKVRKVQKRA